MVPGFVHDKFIHNDIVRNNEAIILQMNAHHGEKQVPSNL